MGLMQALEIVEPGADQRPDPNRTVALIDAARRHGLLVGKGGLWGNVIRIAPALNITGEKIEDGCDRLSRAADDVA